VLIHFIVDLLGCVMVGDTARARIGRESVMRHFLPPAFPIPALTLGVTHAPAQAPLITRSGSPQALAAGLLSAALSAIPLPVIAPPAYPHLLPAALAIEHSIGIDASLHARQPNQKAGQRRSVASLS